MATRPLKHPTSGDQLVVLIDMEESRGKVFRFEYKPCRVGSSVRSSLRECGPLDEVIFCCFSRADRETYERVLRDEEGPQV